MLLDPVSYSVGAKEMKREGKLEPTERPETGKPSDFRNYLFVEMNIDVDLGGNRLWAAAVVDGVTWRSDHGKVSGPAFRPLRVADGRHQVAVELPPGTTIADIQQVGIAGAGNMTGTLFFLDAFMLNTDYFPAADHIVFSGSLVASGVNPTWMLTP
ncbi:MAG: hypothetical protein ACE5E4_04710 [Candidatus Binatia bacterium]